MVKERKGFMKWYNSPQGKKIMGVAYSLGASIVIIGALFKILHWPYASEMLMVGMMAEAILFAIGILDDPHADLHWDHVFPQLVSKESDPLMNYIGSGMSGGVPTGGGGGNFGGSTGGGGNFGGMVNCGTISDDDAKKLTESIKKMSETAAQLANISKVADLTDSYAKNLTKAADAAAKFAEKQQGLDTASDVLLDSYKGISDNLIAAKDNTKSFADKANEVSKNLGSINTAYELQLKNIQAQVDVIDTQNKKISAVTADFEKIQGCTTESIKYMNSYKQMTEQLAKNISDLNGVYGNMLNALKA